MQKVTFMRWMIDRNGRRPIAVDPSRVDIVEHYQDEVTNAGDKHRVPIAVWWGEEGHEAIPAATRIIMRNKQEFFVQGTVADVTAALNQAHMDPFDAANAEIVRQMKASKSR